MSIGRREIERIAELARLELDDEALPRLAEEIGRILAFVANLDGAPAAQTDDSPDGYARGPAPPMRDDRPRADPPRVDPAAFAPEFRDGLFFGPAPETPDEP